MEKYNLKRKTKKIQLKKKTVDWIFTKIEYEPGDEETKHSAYLRFLGEIKKYVTQQDNKYHLHIDKPDPIEFIFKSGFLRGMAYEKYKRTVDESVDQIS
jgi:hypothetical protein